MGRGARPARREGWRSRRVPLHAPRASHSSSIDELSDGRARSCLKPREPPLKSESLQKDQRSMRYNRFDGDPRLAERISPLSVDEAWRSALRSEDRRASNSGLRGHCRAFDGPIASARRRARRAIGGLPGPASRARSAREFEDPNLAAHRGQGRARLSRPSVGVGHCCRLRHTTKIFLVMEREWTWTRNRANGSPACRSPRDGLTRCHTLPGFN